jgi:hypothetical protein
MDLARKISCSVALAGTATEMVSSTGNRSPVIFCSCGRGKINGISVAETLKEA